MYALVIYDNEGYVLSVQRGEPAPREPVGVPYMWVEIPQGKRIVRVDVSVTPHVPIFEELPPSETDLLKQRIELLEDTITELILGV